MRLQREEIEVIKYCGLASVAMAMPKCHFCIFLLFFYDKKLFKVEDQ